MRWGASGKLGQLVPDVGIGLAEGNSPLDPVSTDHHDTDPPVVFDHGPVAFVDGAEGAGSEGVDRFAAADVGADQILGSTERGHGMVVFAHKTLRVMSIIARSR